MNDGAGHRRFVVRTEKITAYLLNARHPDGWSKAKFFFGYGFSAEHPQILAEALFLHARPPHLVRELATPWGPRYVFEGPLSAPNGMTPRVRTVWQVAETVSEEVALVTVVAL